MSKKGSNKRSKTTERLPLQKQRKPGLLVNQKKSINNNNKLPKGKSNQKQGNYALFSSKVLGDNKCMKEFVLEVKGDKYSSSGCDVKMTEAKLEKSSKSIASKLI